MQILWGPLCKFSRCSQTRTPIFGYPYIPIVEIDRFTVSICYYYPIANGIGPKAIRLVSRANDTPRSDDDNDDDVNDDRVLRQKVEHSRLNRREITKGVYSKTAKNTFHSLFKG